MTKVHKRLQKTRPSLELAADVVEKVLLTGDTSAGSRCCVSCVSACHTDSCMPAGGEPYLDTRAGLLTWWQLALLDVYALLAGAAVLAAALVSLLLSGVYRGVRAVLPAAKGKHKRA